MKSIVIGLRCDIRSIATLALYWQETTKTPPKRLGTLMRDMLESLAENVSRNKTHLRVETVENAQSVLENLGIAPQSKESKRALIKGLEVESMQLEAATDILDDEMKTAFREAKKKLEEKEDEK